ncbi:MAG: cytochrome c-552 precursor [Alphaproteobacteria bacterium]|nr:cytochrome c-552 precursor [Alphaproteobacteria bacterium]
MNKPCLKTSLAALGFMILLGAAPAHAAIDWAKVPGKDVAMFYPGQSPWEWVLTPSDHEGAAKFRAGKDCFQCHNGDEKTMGDILVSGKRNGAAVPGKPGSIVAQVKFAHDAQNLYVRLVFAEGRQPDAGMDKAYATKVTMMLDDGSVPEATRAGCWGMCHDDNTMMPAANGADRTMYLPRTHAHLTAHGGGDELKPADDLAKLKAGGYWLEYWQARLNAGKPAVAVNGEIFAKREETHPTAVSAQASYAGGKWTVTFTRKLDAGAGFKAIVPGKTYTIGFAIHSGHTAKRFHYVSFERTLVLDSGNADFVAAKE